MKPSSRTPEGEPNRCPVCGHEVRIEPSYPPGDAPCPCCGHLLWFSQLTAYTPDELFSRSTPSVLERLELAEQGQQEEFDRFERVTWLVLPSVSSLVVLAAEQSVVLAVLWLTLTMTFGQVALPVLFRRARSVSQQSNCFFRDVIFGWALVPGPTVGILAGVILPFVYDWPVGSFFGGLVGLALRPVFAAIEGVTLVGFISIVIWLVTGKSLASHAV